MTWGNPNPSPSTWNPNDPNYKPQLENAAWLAERDRLLAEWETAKTTLEAAKESEMTARKAAQAFAFGPGAREGMNNQPLANGFELKFGKKLNYKFSASNEKIDAIEDQAAKIGNEGTFLIERIITWTPNFSKSEYNKLDASNPTHSKIKALVDSVLEITEATGSLEIKAPKAKLNG
jgi:hypothetical protein